MSKTSKPTDSARRARSCHVERSGACPVENTEAERAGHAHRRSRAAAGPQGWPRESSAALHSHRYGCRRWAPTHRGGESRSQRVGRPRAASRPAEAVFDLDLTLPRLAQDRPSLDAHALLLKAHVGRRKVTRARQLITGDLVGRDQDRSCAERLSERDRYRTSDGIPQRHHAGNAATAPATSTTLVPGAIEYVGMPGREPVAAITTSDAAGLASALTSIATPSRRHSASSHATSGAPGPKRAATPPTAASRSTMRSGGLGAERRAHFEASHATTDHYHRRRRRCCGRVPVGVVGS